MRIVSRRSEFRRAQEEEDLAAAMLREMDSAENIAESVKIDLLNLVKECVRANPDDPREVERLVRSAVNLSNTAKEKQIADLRRKLDRANAEIAELKAEIAELNVELETVKAGTDQKPGQAGISPETLAKVEQKIKML